MWRCRDSGVCQESYIPYSDGIAQRQGGVVQCSTLLRKAIVAYVCSDKIPNIFFNPTIKPYVLHKHHVGVLVSFCNLKKLWVCSTICMTSVQLVATRCSIVVCTPNCSWAFSWLYSLSIKTMLDSASPGKLTFKYMATIHSLALGFLRRDVCEDLFTTSLVQVCFLSYALLCWPSHLQLHLHIYM